MFFLFRLLSHLPLRVLHALGAGLGWLVWCLSPSYRATFKANVAQAGLPFSKARPAIAETGRFVGELPKLWMRPHGESCLAQVQLRGREHAEAAFAKGRGVIFFAPHCGSFELAPQALAELYGPITAMYRPARQPWLARLMHDSRHRPGLAVVPASLSGIRQMHKALKSNGAVALLTDQVPPDGLGVWAPFFGRPAYTMTLAARLALQNGAPMLPVVTRRLGQGRGYTLDILPPLAGLAAEPAPDLQAAVTQINQALEVMILDQADQYLWGYARYKTPRREGAGKAVADKSV